MRTEKDWQTFSLGSTRVNGGFTLLFFYFLEHLEVPTGIYFFFLLLLTPSQCPRPVTDMLPNMFVLTLDQGPSSSSRGC